MLPLATRRCSVHLHHGAYQYAATGQTVGPLFQNLPDGAFAQIGRRTGQPTTVVLKQSQLVLALDVAGRSVVIG